MAVDMFLSFDGTIEGDSQDSTHAGEIDVQSFSWGESQSGTTHLGPGGGAGKVSVQDLSLTKFVDKSTPNLWLFCAKGTHIPKAILTIRRAGDSPLEYMILTMEEVLISSVQEGASRGAGDIPMESVSLNFAKFKLQYQPQGPDGAALGGSIDVTWNIPANAVE